MKRIHRVFDERRKAEPKNQTNGLRQRTEKGERGEGLLFVFM